MNKNIHRLSNKIKLTLSMILIAINALFIWCVCVLYVLYFKGPISPPVVCYYQNDWYNEDKIDYNNNNKSYYNTNN